MGEVDIKKEWPNVRRMQVLGCKVVPATHGQKTLKEAVRVEKQRSLTQSMADRLLCLPSAPSSLPLPLRLSLSLSLSLTHVCLHCACAQVDSAFGAYMEDPETMLFAIGSTVGPHP